MKCPACDGTAIKVIAAALPMKLCTEDGCRALWGEPFATIYTFLFAPLEGWMNRGFYFLAYEGSYFYALWDWLTLKGEES
jgi:hypothetical protein